MTHTTLGRTNWQVSRLGYGAIKLPEVDQATATRALNRALDLGINFVDTARAYQDSERKIGVALGHRRPEYYLATKTTQRTAEGLRQELQTSLSELGTDYIDLYQLHSVSTEETWQAVMAPDGALQAAIAAREAGHVREVGITIHRSLSVMEAAIRSGQFATIMLAYSPLDQEGVGVGMLPLAARQGVATIIMKALGGGTLITPEHEAVAGPDHIVASCLRHVLARDDVSVVIPGMRSEREVEENVTAWRMAEPLSEAEVAELYRRIGSLGREFRYGQVCLQCGYCQPCPEGIDIPRVFRAWAMLRSYPDGLLQQAFSLYDEAPVPPSACVGCGACEEVCPPGLAVRERLEEAARAFAEAR